MRRYSTCKVRIFFGKGRADGVWMITHVVGPGASGKGAVGHAHAVRLVAMVVVVIWTAPGEDRRSRGVARELRKVV